MGMQLTETLHGILPIAPSEDFRNENGGADIEIHKNAVGFPTSIMYFKGTEY